MSEKVFTAYILVGYPLKQLGNAITEDKWTPPHLHILNFRIFTEDWVLFPCIFSPTKFGGVEGSGVSKKYHENFKISDKKFNLTQPTQDPHLHHRLDGDWQEHPFHRNHQSVHVVHQGEVLHFNNAENASLKKKPGSWNPLIVAMLLLSEVAKAKVFSWGPVDCTMNSCYLSWPLLCSWWLWLCNVQYETAGKAKKKWTIKLSVFGW